MRLYRIVSGRWRVSYILANSSVEAVVTAIEVGTHVEGRKVRVTRIAHESLPDRAMVLILRAEQPGRVHFRSPFRSDYILEVPDE